MPTSKDIIYYTDYHDVDEETRTITAYGGYWLAGNQAGITYRHPYDDPTVSGDYVASYV